MWHFINQTINHLIRKYWPTKSIKKRRKKIENSKIWKLYYNIYNTIYCIERLGETRYKFRYNSNSKTHATAEGSFFWVSMYDQSIELLEALLESVEPSLPRVEVCHDSILFYIWPTSVVLTSVVLCWMQFLLHLFSEFVLLTLHSFCICCVFAVNEFVFPFCSLFVHLQHVSDVAFVFDFACVFELAQFLKLQPVSPNVNVLHR